MRRLLLAVFVILFACLQGMAQTPIAVTGKVTDEKGASVAGATITEKGTRNATTTTDDGTFTLKTKAKAKLVIIGGGSTPATVLPCFIDYHFTDYWDVPRNELDFNPPSTNSAPIINP
jgi:Carboxypeptidase regulatory-like domain